MIDICTRQALAVPMKNKVPQTTTDEFSNTILKVNRKPSLIETVDGKEFVNKTFTKFLNNNNNKTYSSYTNKGAVLLNALIEQNVIYSRSQSFEKEMQNELTEYLKYLKKTNIDILFSTKMALRQAIIKSDENEVYKNKRGKRKTGSKNLGW